MKYMTFMVTDSEAEPYIPGEDGISGWVEETLASGANIIGDRIRDREEGRVVRVRNGELLVTDGPFTESKEWINGWNLVEFADLDEAIEVMSKHPVARFGQIEIRPLWSESGVAGIDLTLPYGQGPKFIMFVVVDPEPDTDTSEEPDIEDWVETMDARGARVGGQRLRGTEDATLLRLRDGEILVTDGPFTESKEWIAGFDLLNVDTMDEAIEVARKHPMARAGRIELREAWPLDL